MPLFTLVCTVLPRSHEDKYALAVQSQVTLRPNGRHWKHQQVRN
jgi:hypothetical protein